MAVGKEIRSKIKSIKNTQKITSAMQMVASSKMRKTQLQMESTRPYAREIIKLASHLAEADLGVHHQFLEKRDVKRVGIIVISSDRGLCGGLNNNLFKLLSKRMAEWDRQNIDVDIVTFGKKANGFFNRFGGNIIATATNLGDKVSSADLIGPVSAILNEYKEGRIDELHVFSNLFVNTMVQSPMGVKLLPIDSENFVSFDKTIGEALHKKSNEAETKPVNEIGHWDYIYDVEPNQLIDLILTRYLESTIYQAVVENIACEMAARMMAMQAATDNAESLVNTLQLAYNKARQAAITQEISEIVGGASALG